MKMQKEAVMAIAVAGLLMGGTGIWAADPSTMQNEGMSDKGQAAPSNVPANAQSSTLGAAQSQSAQNQAEKQVLNELHKDNQAEIQLGQLAQQNGQAAEVKEFGQHLMNDHQQADTQVLNLASSQSIPLAEVNAPSADQRAMQKLQSISGADFDKAFLRDIKKAHERTINKLEIAQHRLPESSQVRQLITQLLPTLQEHRDRAQQLQQTALAK